jgi:hypothetical protein
VQEHFRKAAVDRVDRPLPAPKAEPAKPTDKILLPLLVADADARERLLGHLRGITAIHQWKTAPVYEILIAMHDAEELVDFNSVHSRLPAALQDTFASIVLDAPLATAEDGLACIEALRREERETERRELKTKIREAERAGRVEEALRLMTELSRLG